MLKTDTDYLNACAMWMLLAADHERHPDKLRGVLREAAALVKEISGTPQCDLIPWALGLTSNTPGSP